MGQMEAFPHFPMCKPSMWQRCWSLFPLTDLWAPRRTCFDPVPLASASSSADVCLRSVTVPRGAMTHILATSPLSLLLQAKTHFRELTCGHSTLQSPRQTQTHSNSCLHPCWNLNSLKERPLATQHLYYLLDLLAKCLPFNWYLVNIC